MRDKVRMAWIEYVVVVDLFPPQRYSCCRSLQGPLNKTLKLTLGILRPKSVPGYRSPLWNLEIFAGI